MTIFEGVIDLVGFQYSIEQVSTHNSACILNMTSQNFACLIITILGSLSWPFWKELFSYWPFLLGIFHLKVGTQKFQMGITSIFLKRWNDGRREGGGGATSVFVSKTTFNYHCFCHLCVKGHQVTLMNLWFLFLFSGFERMCTHVHFVWR